MNDKSFTKFKERSKIKASFQKYLRTQHFPKVITKPCATIDAENSWKKLLTALMFSF